VELLDEINVADLRALYSDSFSVAAQEFSGVHSAGLYRCLESGLRFFHPVITGSESFYEALQHQSWYYLEAKPEYDFARGFISENDSILEVGCGRGEFAKKIAAKATCGWNSAPKLRTWRQRKAFASSLNPSRPIGLEYERHYDRGLCVPGS
jgi:SAM-dependent methyltransferase